ncbi:MAG: VacJ family lipoprotein [Pseudorhodobacter sp.]|nr:VacJ family lipoprotein [Pseudorhodobacter sp.]
MVILSACAAPPPPATFNDPEEARNREIHAFNLALDKALVRPASDAYGSILPAPVQQGVANFSANLDIPGEVVNQLLQGRPHYAIENTFRFAVNTVIGLGGLFDPATAIGVHGKRTDFGETLHVWGAGEGVYVELPVLGPSTERDAVGKLVDIVMNPVSLLLPSPEKYYVTVAKIGSKIGDRHRYSKTVDSILYDSADGYAQARLLYLQSRRFELGQAVAAEDFEDPYAE